MMAVAKDVTYFDHKLLNVSPSTFCLKVFIQFIEHHSFSLINLKDNNDP